MRSVGFAIVVLIVVFVLVRMVISARTRREDLQPRRGRRAATLQDDPWSAAEALAAQQRHEEAAHALYRGVLLAIAASERVRLDPSKTSGDYTRELRRRGSPSVTRFRSFTRRYESAVFGHERCTSEVFAELRALSDSFRQHARAA